MKSLLILGVLLCVALCVRSAAIETLEATEENIQPYVSVEAEPEVELELALPQEDQTAVIEEQLETGDQGVYSFCPDGWAPRPGSCYRPVFEKKTWADARATCIRLGGTLASVSSPQEMEFLQKTYNNIFNGKMWIGGYYFQGHWGWVDGTKFDLLDFSSSNPASNSCLTLDKYRAARPVGQAACSSRATMFYAICEKASIC